MLSTTEELYGMSANSLNFRIDEELNKRSKNLWKAAVDVRIKYLTATRDRLLQSSLLDLSKEEDMLLNNILKALVFWEGLR